jgi:hypothetical protein
MQARPKSSPKLVGQEFGSAIADGVSKFVADSDVQKLIKRYLEGINQLLRTLWPSCDERFVQERFSEIQRGESRTVRVDVQVPHQAFPVVGSHQNPCPVSEDFFTVLGQSSLYDGTLPPAFFYGIADVAHKPLVTWTGWSLACGSSVNRFG